MRHKPPLNTTHTHTHTCLLCKRLFATAAVYHPFGYPLSIHPPLSLKHNNTQHDTHRHTHLQCYPICNAIPRNWINIVVVGVCAVLLFAYMKCRLKSYLYIYLYSMRNDYLIWFVSIVLHYHSLCPSIYPFGMCACVCVCVSGCGCVSVCGHFSLSISICLHTPKHNTHKHIIVYYHLLQKTRTPIPNPICCASADHSGSRHTKPQPLIRKTCRPTILYTHSHFARTNERLHAIIII